MTKTTYVTLKIMDDDENRPWWDALKIPPPVDWDEYVPQNAHVTIRMEVEAARPR